MANGSTMNLLGNARSLIVGCVVMMTLALAAGCAPPADSRGQPPDGTLGDGRRVAPITATDACANNLHDISGALLLYLDLHGELPPTLHTLQAAPGGAAISFQCPVSERPYVYNPSGIHLAERGTYIIVHDPEPSHSGIRWAITMDAWQAGEPPVMKVMATPESVFFLHGD